VIFEPLQMSQQPETDKIQEPSSVDRLSASSGVSWNNLAYAKIATTEKLKSLKKDLAGFDNADTSIVVFGSLARDEVTRGSDIDWTLLVDGKADPKHHDVAKEIECRIDEASKPGREGIFGTLAFSHQILHFIGGGEDSNANITRRILLLLESTPIGNRGAWESVRSNLLRRYITEDHGLLQKKNSRGVPLFLLNDISRFWRTMVVDFAYKQRHRGNEGYALRNLKLGLSRKLIYASGLLACFGCDLDFPEKRLFESPNPQRATDHLLKTFRRNPLEILADAILKFEVLQDAGLRAFNAYDEFLGLLEDDTLLDSGRCPREHLKMLAPEELESDPVFQKGKDMRRRFGEALLDIFLRIESPIQQLMIERGVF
jgi:predicted nucleotidyltransferase